MVGENIMLLFKWLEVCPEKELYLPTLTPEVRTRTNKWIAVDGIVHINLRTTTEINNNQKKLT